MKFSEKILVKLIALIKGLLLKRNIFLSRTTHEDSLIDFFKRIRPLKTNFELVRMGSNLDGGYLLPNDLGGIDGCFSPGVSTTSDFELEMAEKGVKCYMADYSVQGPPIQHELFYFERKFLGSENNTKFITLEEWVNRNARISSDMILQMDIEGAEYEVIVNTPVEILKRFRIIIIEFHDLEQLLNKLGFTLIDQTFRKLLSLFEIVHIHPNNIMKDKMVVYKNFEIPSVLEITFLRKDRISQQRPITVFPHPLDKLNSLDFEDYILPKTWYQH
jgi:hypothetical protein